jgi:hypothetical protein
LLQHGEPPAPPSPHAKCWKSLIAPGKVDFWHKVTAIYHFCRVTPPNEFIKMMCSDSLYRWSSDPRRRDCYNAIPCTLAKVSLIREGMPLDELFERLSVAPDNQVASSSRGTRLGEHPAHRPPLTGRAAHLFALATGHPDDKERLKWQEGAPECASVKLKNFFSK